MLYWNNKNIESLSREELQNALERVFHACSHLMSLSEEERNHMMRFPNPSGVVSIAGLSDRRID